MPKLDNENDKLKPFTSNGMEFFDTDREQARANCPFCENEDDKFYVKQETTTWQCFNCGRSGNSQTFLEQLYEMSDEAMTAIWNKDVEEEYKKLASSRSLLDYKTLTRWGMVKNIINDKWIIPGYNQKGRICNLYRWINVKDKEGNWKYKLFPTTGMFHGYFAYPGVMKEIEESKEVWLVEGVWNAMAIWEAKQKSNPILLATPGANVFSKQWVELFNDKKVTLLYDNDHPHKTKHGMREGAAWAGLKKVVRELAKGSGTGKPKSLYYLNWGEHGYNPDLPSGYDPRDHLKNGSTVKERQKLLKEYLSGVIKVPNEVITSVEDEQDEAPPIEIKECNSYKVLVNSWRKAMTWIPGLDKAFACMLATITSTRMVDAQLWMQVISPAGTGKSTLCEAISVARKYVLAKSTIRGFHSGWGGGKGDGGLITKLKDRTFVIKDGDTLLRTPNKEQILSEMRDIYDRVSRASYRNKTGVDHEGINTTMILCGTGSFRELDASEMGQRFLVCSIMDEIDEDLEDQIGWKVANRVFRSAGCEVTEEKSSHYDPATLEAMQLTGGYIEYLRENARELLSRIRMSDDCKRKCTLYGKFAAYMRARPSKKHDESGEREFSPRLIAQHTKLAMCLAVAYGKEEVDEKVIKIVRSVALDTAKGNMLDIFKSIYDQGSKGVEPKGLAIALNMDENLLKSRLRFLRKIKVLEVFQRKIAAGIKGQQRWRVTDKVSSLYEEVMNED